MGPEGESNLVSLTDLLAFTSRLLSYVPVAALSPRECELLPSADPIPLAVTVIRVRICVCSV